VSEHPLAAAAALAGVSDPRVLDAVASVPRADFVPPELAAAAERDTPLPIPHEQVTTQPSLVAAMVEALAVTGPRRSSVPAARPYRRTFDGCVMKP
jgi:protein-L-isoaspartate(D-aspartate) O-methyltransferase